MKVPKFDDRKYNECSSCENIANSYFISIKCLHKLCDICYKNKMRMNTYECKFCQNENKGNNSYRLSKEDFIKNDSNNNSILKDFYRRDKTNREKIMFKTRENFKSEEEYNDFLEYVEKCLKKNNLDDIQKIYSQSNEEKERNKKERKEKIETMREKISKNEPNSYNNTKICITLFEEGIQNQEEKIKIDPIVVIEQKINYIKDEERERICGGYNINNIYEFLSNFSKGGFKNIKI